MATPTTMTDLSTTIASNSPAGSESPTNGDDFLRAIQGILRRTNAKGSDIASATTTDIGAATAEFVDVTGTTTITGLGTIDAGISRVVRFTGALTLTYNATSLILPGNANITTANGDVAFFRSLGSGNWLCTNYVKRDGTAITAPYLPLAGGTMTGDITMSASMLKFAKGADVASATALPLITDGNYFDVTGTTTITSFNSVGVGTLVGLHFDGALTLTHNATDLILPGGANITTAAGDEALFIEYASGDYRCISYTKANGTALIGGITTTSSVATTSGTSIDFGNGSNGVTFPAVVNRVVMILSGVSTSSTSVVQVQLGTSGGVVSTGYTGISDTQTSGGGTATSFTSGLGLERTGVTSSTSVRGGRLVAERIGGTNTWVMTYQGYITTSGTFTTWGTATIALSGAFDRIRLTTVNGTDTFDAGAATVNYE